MPQVLKRAGIKKITAKFDPLIATYRSVIKTDDRRVASRGAQAIRWAQHNEMTPVTVLEFPGGVDSWSREWQKFSRKAGEGAGGKVKPNSTTVSQRITELRKELKDGAGAVLLIKKIGTQLVSLGYHKIKKVEKAKQWPKIKQAVTKPAQP